MFACNSRFRRLQTCATGMERPLTAHHGPNVSSHAQYQKAQLDVRLQFEISQVANLRYREERPLTAHHGPNVSSHAQYQKAQLDVR